MSDHSHNDNNMASFVTGVIIGAALTYFFATKNGQKLKEALLKEAGNALEGVDEEIKEAKAEFDSAKQKIEKKVEKGKEEVEKKVDLAQKVIEEKVENVKVAFGEPRPKGREEVGQIVREVPKEVSQQVQTKVGEVQKKGRHFFFRRRQKQQES